MEPQKKIKRGHGPEYYIQQAIIKKLRGLEWFVKSTHGNVYQSGFPDLYCHHRSYGQRWIECKNSAKFCFTPAQLECFPQFSAVGCGIWILTNDSEAEYQKLFKQPNWYQFLSLWSGSR